MNDWDLALESLTRVLETLRDHRFVLPGESPEGVNDEYSNWVRHLLFVTSPPGHPERDPRSESGRDWKAMESFVLERRMREVAELGQSLTNFRVAIATFVEGMTQMVNDARETDALAWAQLANLKGAVDEGRGAEEIQHAVTNTVMSVRSLLEIRQTRQSTRVDFLTRQVHDLLEEARLEGGADEPDTLTRLDGRKTFDKRLSRASAMKQICGDSSCMLLLDINHYYEIASEHGPAAADVILKKLGRLLTLTFPRKGDSLSRYQDSLFAVLLWEANQQDAERLAERVLKDVRELHVVVEDKVIPITLSIGVAEASLAESGWRWFRRAEQALKVARDNDGNQVVVLEPLAVSEASPEPEDA